MNQTVLEKLQKKKKCSKSLTESDTQDKMTQSQGKVLPNYQGMVKHYEDKAKGTL